MNVFLITLSTGVFSIINICKYDSDSIMLLIIRTVQQNVTYNNTYAIIKVYMTVCQFHHYKQACSLTKFALEKI